MGTEPEEVRGYLATPDPGLIRFEGSTVPILGARPLAPLGGPLVGPAAQADAASYAASYLTLSEYVDLSNEPIPVDMSSLIRLFADDNERQELVAHVVKLNHIAGNAGALAKLQEAYRTKLRPDTQARFDGLLEDPDHRRVFLSKQPLLATLRHLLTTDPETQPANRRAPMVNAILLTHAVASTLEADRETALRLGNMPAYLLLEVVRTALLGHTVDIHAALDRVVRLWRDHGAKVTKGGLGQTPLELLTEATKLDLIEILGFTFALLVRRINGLEPSDPIFERPDLGVRADPDRIARFLGLTSDTWDGLRRRLATSDRRFGFLAFEATPILSTDIGLLVIDEDYLWQRITTGLYWMVHDYLKFTRAPGTYTNLRWNQAYGEMVELYVEDSLRRMAPPLLHNSGGKTFYTEEDMELAYGDTKKCDAVVFVGSAFLMVEVIGGQMTVPTRIDGDPEQFVRDTDRLVIDKCRQLSEACDLVKENEKALTGFPPTPGVRFVPIVVVGGGYPVNPATRQYIGRQIKEEGLFAAASVGQALSILDLEDIDMLEGLWERGNVPVDVLLGWRESHQADLPFKSYVIARFGGWGASSRPTRMRDTVTATFNEMIEVLGIREGQTP